jgi:hypothetical protein
LPALGGRLGAARGVSGYVGVTMARRLPLQSPTPSVEVARKRLGGRAITGPGAGELVTVTTSLGLTKQGAVVFVAGDELDVWIAEDTVMRTSRERTVPLRTAVPKEMSAVAADARVFASLHEGQRVRYLLAGEDYAEAMLVEKCRWGALLLRDDGTLVGVGFRRVWPVADGTLEAN